MDLEFPAREVSSRNLSLQNSHIVIWISKEAILPTFGKLSDFKRDAKLSVERGQLHCDPEFSMKLLYTIQHIVNRTELGLNDNNGEELPPATPFYLNNLTNEFCDSTEEFVEFIYSVPPLRVLLGWRFWFLAQNENYSFDTALRKLMCPPPLKKGRRPFIPFPPPSLPVKRSRYDMPIGEELPNVLEPASCIKHWIDYALSPYMCERLSDPVLSRNIYARGINDRENPANVLNCLTFEYSSRIIQQTCPQCDPVYLDPDNYYRNNADLEQQREEEEDDDDENVLVHANAHAPENPHHLFVRDIISFPRGGFYVNVNSRDPAIFFRIDLSRPPLDPQNAEWTRRVREHRERTQLSSLDRPTIGILIKKSAQEINVKLDTMTPDQIAEYRTSPEFLDMFRSLCAQDDFDQGGLLLSRWYENRVHADPNLSFVRANNRLIDSTLSEFGNRIAYDMLFIEEAAGVSYLHLEILSSLQFTMSSGNMSLDINRTNFCLLSPPGVGKSYFLSCRESLLPEGFIQTFGHQTRRSMTTEVNYNGRQCHLDEASELFTGVGDGSGNADIKSLISKGYIDSFTTLVEGRSRITVVTRTWMISQIFICSNLPTLPLAIRDRFITFFVPSLDRRDKQPAIEAARILTDEKFKERHGKLKEHWSKFLFLSSRYWRLTQYGPRIMPLVDNSLAIELGASVFRSLNDDYGILVDTREQQRILLACVSVCLYDAISEVFETDKYFPAGTPFCASQLFQLIPHLVVTQEHFIYTVTLFEQVMVNPMVPFVCRAILDIVNEKRDTDEMYAPGDAYGTYQYDYYFVPSTLAASKSLVQDLVATRVRERVRIMFDQSISLSMTMDILNWFMLQTKSVNVRRHGENAVSGNARSLSVASVINAANRCGFKILRDFVDSIIRQRESVVMTCLKKTITDQCTQQRFITGTSYRFGFPGAPAHRIFPQYLYVMEKPADAGNSLMVRDPHFKPFLRDYILNDDSDEQDHIDIHSYYLRVESDLTQEKIAEWRGRTFSPVYRPGYVDNRRYMCQMMDDDSSYPTFYVKTSLEEFGEVLQVQEDRLPFSHQANVDMFAGGHDEEDEPRVRRAGDAVVFNPPQQHH